MGAKDDPNTTLKIMREISGFFFLMLLFSLAANMISISW